MCSFSCIWASVDDKQINIFGETWEGPFSHHSFLCIFSGVILVLSKVIKKQFIHLQKLFRSCDKWLLLHAEEHYNHDNKGIHEPILECILVAVATTATTRATATT